MKLLSDESEGGRKIEGRETHCGFAKITGKGLGGFFSLISSQYESALKIHSLDFKFRSVCIIIFS